MPRAPRRIRRSRPRWRRSSRASSRPAPTRRPSAEPAIPPPSRRPVSPIACRRRAVACPRHSSRARSAGRTPLSGPARRRATAPASISRTAAGGASSTMPSCSRADACWRRTPGGRATRRASLPGSPLARRRPPPRSQAAVPIFRRWSRSIRRPSRAAPRTRRSASFRPCTVRPRRWRSAAALELPYRFRPRRRRRRSCSTTTSGERAAAMAARTRSSSGSRQRESRSVGSSCSSKAAAPALTARAAPRSRPTSSRR
jgi:hypothetical protein